jgi:hypothetical protein
VDSGREPGTDCRLIAIETAYTAPGSKNRYVISTLWSIIGEVFEKLICSRQRKLKKPCCLNASRRTDPATISRLGVAAAALRKVTPRTPGKGSLGQFFVRKPPIPGFSATRCVKSLRAISIARHKRVRRAVFHATNRGSNVGDHIAYNAAMSWRIRMERHHFIERIA